MKKILNFLLLLILIFSFQITNWEDTKYINPINKVIYEWFLTNDTDVYIEGNSLDKCKLVSISDKYIKYVNENWKIKFNTKDLWENYKKWTILLNCNGQLYYKEFAFPYISNFKIELDNNKDNIIQVFWENFWENSSLYIWNYTLSFKEKNDRYILANLNKEINNNEIYIESNWNKSNKLELNIKSPIIKYIKSNNWFKKGSNLKIYFDNFNFSSNSSLIIETDNTQENINLLKDYFKKDYFQIKLDDKYIWEIRIFIIQDSLKSNVVELNITWEIPIIKQVTQWINKQWDKILKITWNNFINSNNLYIYVNKTICEDIESINTEEIILKENDTLKKWNNFIKLIIWKDKNKLTSNIYNLFIPWDKEPFIWDITVEGLTPDYKKRIFRLTTNYFSKKSDNLLFNWGYISDYGYYGNIIKVKLNKNITKGYFSFSRNNKRLNYVKYFDISYEKTPYINYIKIDWKLRAWSKVIIAWKNFKFSQISESNLLWKNDEQKIDTEISDNKIIWYLPKDFDIEKNSSLSITNNWLTNSLNFNFKKLNTKQINWKFIFKELINKNNSFTVKQWDIIKIFWSYFHLNDKLYINNKKIDYKYINANQIEVNLPVDIKPWIHSFKIKNNIWIETPLDDIYIYNKKLNPKIKIYQLKNENTYIEVNPINQNIKNNLLLNYEIDNKINDIQIKKIIFKIKDYNEKNNMLGEFKLILNNTIVWKRIINQKWEIIFEKPFILKKDLENKQHLKLRKSSPYVKDSKFEIILDKINAIYTINWNEKEITNIEINNLNTKFNVFFSKKEIESCIDKENKLIACQNLIQINEVEDINKEKEQKKLSYGRLNYLKLLANSRHKLQKSLKWQKYIKLIDKLTIKYSKNLDNLLKLDKKIKALQEKLKNKNWLKYQETKNVINYLDAKISLEIIKQTK